MTVLVDTSVWIGFLRGGTGPEIDRLTEAIRDRTVATTDVVLLEVLSGTTDEGEARRLRRMLAGAELLRQVSPLDAEQAGALYRACRRGGETPRSLNDCVVAAVAVRHDVPLLHRDRDFVVLARHTRLRTLSSTVDG